MTIKQISVFLENKSGRLAEVLGSLGDKNIKINALTIADTSEYGILRLIVNDFQQAVDILKDKGFTVNLTEVIAVSTPSQAGSFAKVLKTLADENISVEYMYAFKWDTNASIILRPENIELALKALVQQKFKLLSSGDLSKL
jgi:ACT domain-containing protein